MLDPLISCIVYAAEMLIAYIFFSRISEKKRKNVIIWLIGLILFEVGACINLVFSNNIWINLFTTFFIHTLFSVLCFDLSPITSLWYALVLTTVNTVTEAIIVFIVSLYNEGAITEYNEDFAVFILECPASKLLYFLVTLVLSCFVRPGRRKSRLPPSLFVYYGTAIGCIMIFWHICMNHDVGESNRYLLALASIILFVSTVFLFVTYQHEAEKEAELSQVKNENLRLQTERSYYEILERQNQQLMSYAHDTKNHLAAIHELNNDPQIDTYIDKLSADLKSYSENCHSGNKLLDVMISKYQIESEKYDIEFVYDVRSCNLGVLEDTDLVSILGNLMDNAIEATVKSKKKTLSLETATMNGYNVLIICNSCDTPPVEANGALISTKPSNTFHGFGLKNVLRTLKKYNGDYAWDYDNKQKTFTVTAMIGEKAQNKP